jgi:hypothetical protein
MGRSSRQAGGLATSGLSREASISSTCAQGTVAGWICGQLLGPVVRSPRDLAECPGVQILATSQETRSNREHEPLRSLPLPEVGAGTATNGAVLFVDVR